MDEQIERLKAIDKCWQEEQRRKREERRERGEHHSNYTPPWKEEGISKDEWRERKLKKAKCVKERWRRKAEKRWQKKSQDEKRRHIESAMREARAREALGEEIPRARKNGMVPEWAGDFPIPQGIHTTKDFDTDELGRRIEHLRERYVDALKSGGVSRLREEEQDLEDEIEARSEQLEKNRQRIEVLIYGHLYPEPEQKQQRAITLLAVDGVFALARSPDSEEETELLDISKQQQIIAADLRALVFNLWILRSVLHRRRRGLPNDCEAWSVLYEQFEVSEEELQQEYEAHGVAKKQRKQSRRGPKPLKEKAPEEVATLIDAVLDFTAELNNRSVAMEKMSDHVCTALMEEHHVGLDSAVDRIETTLEILRDDCGISFPEGSVYTVKYHAKNRKLWAEGKREFARRFQNNSA